MKKKLFLVALVAMTLIGCEQKQSEFVLDGRAQTATITGKVTWPNAEGKMVAKDNAAVRVVVANTEYSAGAEGDKQFPAVYSDQDGFYTLQVPVGEAGISNVSVEVVPFMGEYIDPNSGVKQAVYYTSGRVPVVVAPTKLNPGDAKNVDIAVKPELTFKDYTASVKISGVITVNAGPQKNSTGYEDILVPYVGQVKVKGEYDVDGTGLQPFDLEDLNLTAENAGAYSFDVPAGATNAIITLTTVRFDGAHNKIVAGEVVTETVYYDIAQLAINVTKDDVEKRNQNFTVTAFDPVATDESKGLIINRLETNVHTWGEVLDNLINEYKISKTYKAFDVQLEFSCPSYDAVNPSSPIANRSITIATNASATDGKVTLTNIDLYKEWAGYNILVRVSVIADKLTTFEHHYVEISHFSTRVFKSKTWAQWHMDDDVSKDLRESFWTNCWPRNNDAKTSYQGYYKSTSRSFNIPATDIKLYKEYVDEGTLIVQFVFRDKNAIKGLWYETRNDEDPENPGSYPKLKAADDAVDAAGETWSNWGVWESSEIRQQDKYQITNSVANGLMDTSKFPNY